MTPPQGTSLVYCPFTQGNNNPSPNCLELFHSQERNKGNWKKKKIIPNPFRFSSFLCPGAGKARPFPGFLWVCSPLLAPAWDLVAFTPTTPLPHTQQMVCLALRLSCPPTKRFFLNPERCPKCHRNTNRGAVSGTLASLVPRCPQPLLPYLLVFLCVCTESHAQLAPSTYLSVLCTAPSRY